MCDVYIYTCINIYIYMKSIVFCRHNKHIYIYIYIFLRDIQQIPECSRCDICLIRGKPWLILQGKYNTYDTTIVVSYGVTARCHVSLHAATCIYTCICIYTTHVHTHYTRAHRYAHCRHYTRTQTHTLHTYYTHTTHVRTDTHIADTLHTYAQTHTLGTRTHCTHNIGPTPTGSPSRARVSTRCNIHTKRTTRGILGKRVQIR